MDKLTHYLELLSKSTPENLLMLEHEIKQKVVVERDVNLLNKIINIIKDGKNDTRTKGQINSRV